MLFYCRARSPSALPIFAFASPENSILFPTIYLNRFTTWNHTEINVLDYHCQCNLGKQQIRVFSKTSLSLRWERIVAKQKGQTLTVQIIDEVVVLCHIYLVCYLEGNMKSFKTIQMGSSTTIQSVQHLDQDISPVFGKAEEHFSGISVQGYALQIWDSFTLQKYPPANLHLMSYFTWKSRKCRKSLKCSIANSVKRLETKMSKTK